MNIPGILEFLKLLAANNNREWFQAHKADYQEVQADFDELLSTVIARIAGFDESVSHVRPQDCTYRIYRDVRFSPDKSPYKNHIGGYINAHGKKSNHCGYYLHLEPGNCMLAGGSWCMPAPMLKAVRQAVFDNIEEYKAIVDDPSIRQYLPVVGTERLKTATKGFPKDSPFIEYVKPKDFTVAYSVPDSFFQDPLFINRIEEVFRQLKRFADFTNYTIDEME